ncbi:hypothetical protein J1605_014535 [Eschrichtius robustus]|uniref:Cornifelin n=1 Tax=Eschrichtius robustus TaxID=9764 RepID=A0AB34GB59_ESCRO|nr:hypothetical protein J1605_014535 [Eschrichtius robustus]
MSTTQGLGRTPFRKESISPPTPYSHTRPLTITQGLSLTRTCAYNCLYCCAHGCLHACLQLCVTRCVHTLMCTATRADLHEYPGTCTVCVATAVCRGECQRVTPLFPVLCSNDNNSLPAEPKEKNQL